MTALGLDTSNYTTSVAVCRDGEVISNVRRLLPVPEGALGLRQSDAVFAHTKALPEAVEEALAGLTGNIDALAASDRPRQAPGSYMPCFLVGTGTARTLAAALGVPLYACSHQQGHIAAALLGSRRTDLLGDEFIALHLSGGTTEALRVSGRLDCRVVAASLDLKAGQAVDRIGGALGLPFPAGQALDGLSSGGVSPKIPRIKVENGGFSLSGLENQCRSLLTRGEPAQNVAAYLFEYLAAVVVEVCRYAKAQCGELPVVLSGGVARNSRVRRAVLERVPGAVFCPAEYSSDNAAGVAFLAAKAAESGAAHGVYIR